MPAVALLTPVDGASGDNGTFRERFYDLSFLQGGADTNYITTGIPINPEDAGLLQIFTVTPSGHATATGVAQTTFPVPSYDYKTGKLQLWGTAGGANGLTEIGAAVSIAAFTYRLRITGI